MLPDTYEGAQCLWTIAHKIIRLARMKAHQLLVDLKKGPIGLRARAKPLLKGMGLCCICFVASCASIPGMEDLARMEEKEQREQLARAESLATLRGDLETLSLDIAMQAALRDRLLIDSVSTEIVSVNSSLKRLSKYVKTHCKQEVIEACEARPQPVVMQADKLVVGQIEHVWIEPPGLLMSARIDSGAQSSSLHANNIVEFERDGSDWVRFDLDHDGREITIERPVDKYVRVLQQSDKDGTRRPVVQMRIFIGDVKESFSFTLADRSHLAHAMILGRNFLTDIALVDVAQEFVQPIYQPSES